VGPGRELLGEGVYTEAAVPKQAPAEVAYGGGRIAEKSRKTSPFGRPSLIVCDSLARVAGGGLFAKP